jgi:hypothetical protein
LTAGDQETRITWQIPAAKLKNLIPEAKLKNLIPAAKLRKFTHLKSKMRNSTRWSSTFTMLQRYLQIKIFLPQLDLDEIDELIPQAREDKEIEALLVDLTQLHSVTMALQSETLTLYDVRSLFDAFIESFPSLGEHLGSNAGMHRFGS